MTNIPNYLRHFCTSEFYIESDADLTKNVTKSTLQNCTKLDLARVLNKTTRTIHHYLKGTRRASLLTLTQLNIGQREQTLKKAYEVMKNMKCGTRAVKLPKRYSAHLAYLSGVICGDGHISRPRGDIMIWNDTPQYLQETISNIILNIFHYQPKFRDFESYGRIDIMSTPIKVFFEKVIGIPSGKKKTKITIPPFVYLKREFKVSFLRGMFDTDGGVTKSKKATSILYSSSNKEFLLQIQQMLTEFGIDMKGPYAQGNHRGFEIRSFKKGSISNFKKQVGSLHPTRSQRLASIAQR